MQDKNEPRKVIYDTDMGSGVLSNEIDDGYGLLLCLALETTELFVDTITEGLWAGVTIGRKTGIGWAVLAREDNIDLKKAKVIWKHDIVKYRDLWLRAIQSLR